MLFFSAKDTFWAYWFVEIYKIRQINSYSSSCWSMYYVYLEGERSYISGLCTLRGHKAAQWLVSGRHYTSSWTSSHHLPVTSASEPRGDPLPLRAPAQVVVWRTIQRLGKALSARTSLLAWRHRPWRCLHVQQPPAICDVTREENCTHEGHRGYRVQDHRV